MRHKLCRSFPPWCPGVKTRCLSFLIPDCLPLQYFDIILLTHWGRVTHICVSKLTTIGSDNGLSPWPAQSHYLNQCWDIVHWAPVNKLQWNFNQNSYLFIQENAFKIVVCEMMSISSRPRYGTPLVSKHIFINRFNGPLTRYVKLRVAHAPGMPGALSSPPTSKENAS